MWFFLLSSREEGGHQVQAVWLSFLLSPSPSLVFQTALCSLPQSFPSALSFPSASTDPAYSSLQSLISIRHHYYIHQLVSGVQHGPWVSITHALNQTYEESRVRAQPAMTVSPMHKALSSSCNTTFQNGDKREEAKEILKWGRTQKCQRQELWRILEDKQSTFRLTQEGGMFSVDMNKVPTYYIKGQNARFLTKFSFSSSALTLPLSGWYRHRPTKVLWLAYIRNYTEDRVSSEASTKQSSSV